MGHLPSLLPFTAKPLERIALTFGYIPSHPAHFSSHCDQGSTEMASAKVTCQGNLRTIVAKSSSYSSVFIFLFTIIPNFLFLTFFSETIKKKDFKEQFYLGS